MHLNNKVAIITGSNRGIGRGLAEAFAEAGAFIVLNFPPDGSDICREEANGTVQSIKAAGGKAIAVEADVVKKDEVENLVSTAVEKFGRVDILVNNAGITHPAMMMNMTEDEWDEVIDIHLKAPFLCSQAVSRVMKKQMSGKIINVASVAGIMGTVGQVNYSTAKGGILSLTMSQARELARYNICVNAISLGVVVTDMTLKIRSDEKLKEIYLNRILLRRFAEIKDISSSFIFLASDESNYITGQLLCVDGGYGIV